MPESTHCLHLAHLWLLVALRQALPVCERLSHKGALEPGMRIALNEYKTLTIQVGALISS
jgi:hypothetical protein